SPCRRFPSNTLAATPRPASWPASSDIDRMTLYRRGQMVSRRSARIFAPPRAASAAEPASSFSPSPAIGSAPWPASTTACSHGSGCPNRSHEDGALPLRRVRKRTKVHVQRIPRSRREARRRPKWSSSLSDPRPLEEGTRIMFFELSATICAALFAGAAVYVTLVEHPARMTTGPAEALRQWRPSYHRATVMQASLAVLGTLA